MRVWASTFNKPVMKCLDADEVTPIEVGAALRTSFIYDLRDDTDDNISNENPYYGELTGLYWVWKNGNIKDDEIVGFCHYGKWLMCSFKRAEKFIHDGYDWITVRNQCIPAYKRPYQLTILLDLLHEKYPDIEAAFKAIYDEDGSSSCCITKNMFITTGLEMNNYCSFLFDVLKELRVRIGDTDLYAGANRYCASLTERLFGAWLLANDKKVKEVDIRTDKWYVTVSKAIANRLPFKGNSNILQWGRHKVYHGSYKQEKEGGGKRS